VAGVTEARATSAGSTALAARSPVITPSDALPPHLRGEHAPLDLAPGFWLLAAADDPDEPTLVAFAGRPLATPFSRSEAARLDALLRLRRTLAPKRAARLAALA
jgi:hypothetical protein